MTNNLRSFVFMVPLILSSIYVHAVGIIYIFEIFAILYFLREALAGRVFRKVELLLLTLSSLLLMRILYSENAISAENLDWFGTFFLLTFFLMGLLSYSKYSWHRAFSIYAGASLGLVASIIMFGNDSSWASLKPLSERVFAYSHIPIFILAILSYPRSRIITGVLLIGAIAIALSNSDRGQAVVYAAALVALGLQTNFGTPNLRLKRRLSDYGLLVASLVVAAILASQLLVAGAKLELFGDRFNSKILSQASHPYGFIAGARPDQIPMIEAAVANPILGYGVKGPDAAWSENMLLLDPGVQALKGDRLENRLERGLVLHSGILGAWIRYGIFGAAFWLFIIGISIKNLRDYLLVQSWQSILVVGCASNLIFEGLFEPGRFRFAIALNLMIVLIANEHVALKKTGQSKVKSSRHRFRRLRNVE